MGAQPRSRTGRKPVYGVPREGAHISMEDLKKVVGPRTFELKVLNHLFLLIIYLIDLALQCQEVCRCLPSELLWPIQ